jgi:hypothetical protein
MMLGGLIPCSIRWQGQGAPRRSELRIHGLHMLGFNDGARSGAASQHCVFRCRRPPTAATDEGTDLTLY